MSLDDDLDGIAETLKYPGAASAEEFDDELPAPAPPERPEAYAGWRARVNGSRLARMAGVTLRAGGREMVGVEAERSLMARLIEAVLEIVFPYSSVLVMSYDGGPGKSTTAAALALLNARNRRGDTVCEVDLNCHSGNADVKLGYPPKQGIDLPTYADKVVAGLMRIFGHLVNELGTPFLLPLPDQHNVPVIRSAANEDVLTRKQFLIAATDVRSKANSVFWDCGTHGIKFRIHKLALGLIATQIVYVILSNEEGFDLATSFRNNLIEEAATCVAGRYKYPRPVRQRMTYLAEHMLVVVNKFDNTDDQQERWVRKIWSEFPKRVFSIPLDHALANDVPIALSALGPTTMHQMLRLLDKVLSGSAQFFRDNGDLNLSDDDIYRLARLPGEGEKEADSDAEFVEGEPGGPGPVATQPAPPDRTGAPVGPAGPANQPPAGDQAAVPARDPAATANGAATNGGPPGPSSGDDGAPGQQDLPADALADVAEPGVRL